MQDALFYQTELLEDVHSGNHSGQNISLIIHNAKIWTGDDKVVQADNENAVVSYAGSVHMHLFACQ